MKVKELMYSLKGYSPTADISLTLVSAIVDGSCQALYIKETYAIGEGDQLPGEEIEIILKLKERP